MAQRTLAFLVLVGCIYGSLAAYLPKRDTTITIPDGVNYVPETQEMCTQTSWTDVASFFLGNYFSHVATVVKSPGEPLVITVLNMAFVLFFPALGAGRGLITIYRRASFYKDPLQQALKAQALVMVIRDKGWKPQPGDSLRSLSLIPKELDRKRAQLAPDPYYRAAHGKPWIKSQLDKLKGYTGPFKAVPSIPPWLIMHYGISSTHNKVEQGYEVSGTCDLPEGYGLAYIPPNAAVEHVVPQITLERILQSSYSLPSGIISVIQIFSACATLYQSKGHQLTRYGYAAFGFTVTPYLLMSFVNLLANCFTPSYPNIYLVHTEIMDEAVRRGGHFTDVIGKLESEPLVAEDLTIFSGSFQRHDNQLWCRIADEVVEHGSTEPIPETTAEGPNLEDGSKHAVNENGGTLPLPDPPLADTPPESTSSPDEEIAQKQAVAVEHESSEGFVPSLIIPACYRFKIAYSNTPSTSILYKKYHYAWRGWALTLATSGLVLLALIPLGVMTKFKPGNSSVAQRVWLMTWYAVGTVGVSSPYFTDTVVGIGYYDNLRVYRDPRYSRGRRFVILFNRLASLSFVFVLLTPAIGGFAVVGQMLIDYGNCTGL